MNRTGQHNTIQLTQGDILPNLIRFSLPILVGQLLQTLYNSVDSIVVGQFVGTSALAAVTASTTITRFFVDFFLGMATGASILFSYSFGAEDYSKLKKAIHTAITFSLVLGTIVALLGAIFAPTLLVAVACPDDVYDEALIYLRIYMLGALFMTLYNTAAAVLRSIGDSQGPFVYLAISSCLNIVLDVLFVVCFHMGVAGVAIATVLAQFVSVILSFRKMTRMDMRYRFSFHEMAIDRTLLKEIVRLGLPAGIQSSMISLSTIYLQRYINGFSSAAIAGIGSAQKIDGFAGMPCNALGLSITTYISQNIGAGQNKRARQGVHIASAAVAIAVTVVGIPVYFFAQPLMSIFSSDPEVISYGVRMLHVIMPVYLIMGFQQMFGGVLRGYGYSMSTMIMVVGGLVGVRQIWLAITLHIESNIQWIYWCYPIGWAATALAEVVFYMVVIRPKFAPKA